MAVAAGEAMAACLYHAPGCHASSEAQMQLAQAAMRLLMSSGPVVLKAAASWLRTDPRGVPQECYSHLRVQLELAECMQ